jgi:hypothetical protein
LVDGWYATTTLPVAHGSAGILGNSKAGFEAERRPNASAPAIPGLTPRSITEGEAEEIWDPQSCPDEWERGEQLWDEIERETGVDIRQACWDAPSGITASIERNTLLAENLLKTDFGRVSTTDAVRTAAVQAHTLAGEDLFENNARLCEGQGAVFGGADATAFRHC